MRTGVSRSRTAERKTRRFIARLLSLNWGHMRLKRAVWFLAAGSLLAQGRSEWVFSGADGKLHYKTDARGNRIMDFSHAGYGGGGVRISSPAVAVRLSAIKGDN